MRRPSSFSLKVYVAIVCLFSWPFQFLYMYLGPSSRPILLISMVMVTVATYVCGKYIFKDGFADAGWSWGKPINYVMAFGLAAFLWLIPSFIERYTGIFSPTKDPSTSELIIGFLTNFFITLLPAFGEEFGWRGYMLPRLLKLHSTRKALLLHGVVTWFWHWPFIVAMTLDMEGNMLINIPVVMLVSIVPTVMHAVVFAYIWSSSQSIAVTTVYHSAFDETRDTLQDKIGFGPLPEPWQMIFLTLMGILVILKAHRQFNRNHKY